MHQFKISIFTNIYMVDFPPTKTKTNNKKPKNKPKAKQCRIGLRLEFITFGFS